MSVSGADNQSRGSTSPDEAVRVYRRFLNALNAGDLDAVEDTVDLDRWREICVGFTSGVIEWPESRESIKAVWKGIPNLKFEPQHLISDGHQVVAVGTAGGDQSGRLFGAPATRRSYSASMFDYVRVENGKIVERIQQADMFSQFQQLFGRLLLGAVIVLCVVLVGSGVLVGALAL